MFRVDVATMAKPKTLVGRVRGPTKGFSYPTTPTILLFLSKTEPGFPKPPPSLAPTFHNHKPRLSLRPRPEDPPIFPVSAPKGQASLTPPTQL